MEITVAEVAGAAAEAALRIESIVCETPLVAAPDLGAACDAEVFLKLENRQHTGSFKLRGAANRLLTLTPEQLQRGCVAASSGNHGAALAYALDKLDAGGLIFVPEQTSEIKVEAIRRYGGDVRFHGTDGLDTEEYARQYAADHGMFYVSPYNDPEIIAGQGTCGIELVGQLADVDAIFVAVGGGGLVSGVGSVLRCHNPDALIVGCQPAASAVMAKSVAAGHILDLPSEPTLSDGTAGGVEANAITFGLCQQLVDEFVLVSEAEIAAAMRGFRDAHGVPVEGAAGVAIAALTARPELARGRKVAVIICGGNVSRSTLDSIL